MKRDVFNTGFAALVSAYSVAAKLPDATQDIYWEMLHGLTDSQFDQAVRDCLSDCSFFPTIAEIGNAALPVNGLGYNWRQQIDRKERAQQERLPDNVRRLINGKK